MEIIKRYYAHVLSIVLLSIGLMLSLPYINSSEENFYYKQYDFQIVFIILYMYFRKNNLFSKISELVILSTFLYVNLLMIKDFY